MAKKKDKKEIITGNPEEQIASLREEIRSIRFDRSGAKTKNVKAIQNKRREIARLLTKIREENNK
jgi:ribosomal protein L29